MAMSREDLLREFSVTAKNKSSAEAIHLLTEFGFQLIRDGREHIYQNDATHKTVRFNPRSDNIGREKWSEIKDLCLEVQQLSQKTGVKMVEYREAVYLPDIPEFRGYVILKSSQRKEAQEAAITEARGIIETKADAYRESLATWERVYGLKILRDTKNDKLTIQIKEAGIQESFEYESASPNEVMAFFKEQIQKADEVFLAREAKLEEFAALKGGATVTRREDDQRIELKPPVGTVRVQTIATFGASNLISQQGMRDLEDMIGKIHAAKAKKVEGIIKHHEEEAMKKQVQPSPTLPDGVYSLGISTRSNVLGPKVIEAKQRVFDALKEVSGAQDMNTLYPLLRAVGFNHEGADKYINPEHTTRPVIGHGNKTAIRGNIERFVKAHAKDETAAKAALKKIKPDLEEIMNSAEKREKVKFER